MPAAMTIITKKSSFRTFAIHCCNARCYNNGQNAVLVFHIVVYQLSAKQSDKPNGDPRVKNDQGTKQPLLDQAKLIEGHWPTFVARETQVKNQRPDCNWVLPTIFCREHDPPRCAD